MSAGAAEDTRLALHPSTGARYVAYRDNANGGKCRWGGWGGVGWGSLPAASGCLLVPAQPFWQQRVGSLRCKAAAIPPLLALPPPHPTPLCSVKRWTGTANAPGQWVAVGPATGFTPGLVSNVDFSYANATWGPVVAFQVGRGAKPWAAGCRQLGAGGQPLGHHACHSFLQLPQNCAAALCCCCRPPCRPISWRLSACPPARTARWRLQDSAANGKASCMRFTAGAWKNVGIPGFSPAAADFLSLAVGPSGPYVAFQASQRRCNATLILLASKCQVPPCCQQRAGLLTRLRLLCLLRRLQNFASPNYQGTVMRWAATKWVTVGGFFSKGEVGDPSTSCRGPCPCGGHQLCCSGALWWPPAGLPAPAAPAAAGAAAAAAQQRQQQPQQLGTHTRPSLPSASAGLPYAAGTASHHWPAFCGLHCEWGWDDGAGMAGGRGFAVPWQGGAWKWSRHPPTKAHQPQTHGHSILNWKAPVASTRRARPHPPTRAPPRWHLHLQTRFQWCPTNPPPACGREHPTLPAPAPATTASPLTARGGLTWPSSATHQTESSACGG